MRLDMNREDVAESMRQFESLAKYAQPIRPMERALIGRDEEKRAMLAAFARPEVSNVMLLAEAGSGKALVDDTPVAVADIRGYVAIGDLVVGDKVFGADGRPREVLAVWPQGSKRVYNLVLENGMCAPCCLDHLWAVDVDGSGTLEVFDTRKVDHLLRAGKKVRIPVAFAQERTCFIGADQAYTVGYGTLIDSPINTYPFNLVHALCIQERACALCGLIDRVKASGRFDESINQKVVSLATSLGIQIANIEKINLKQIYLESNRISNTGHIPSCEDAWTYIVRVEDTHKTSKMTCITVDSPDGLYLCTYNNIVTHNTALVQGVSEDDMRRPYFEVNVAKMLGDANGSDEIAASLGDLFADAALLHDKTGLEPVLFMDEFHQIVQISPAAVEALKPLLAASARRGIRVIAATTYDEFREHISSNQPLVERFFRLNLKETDKQTVRAILEDMAIKCGVASDIRDKSILDLIYEYSNRYIPANAQPRKSILLLDAMIGWYRAFGRPLDSHLLADIIHSSENVNVAFNVDGTTIKKRLDARVYAQDYATSVIEQRLQLCVADLNDHGRPMSSFLFTGSTGVGKTEVTKQLANILFGDAKRHILLYDMSEYANPDSLERFRIDLTQRVWERPYCIILLDEIEKACAEVTRLLLQVLDDGRLTDANGREVTFVNSYVIMTTNAGSEIYRDIAQYMASDTGSGEFVLRYDPLIRRSLSQTTGDNKFPPELLGRVDAIVPFQPLSLETMRKIARKKVSDLIERVKETHNIDLFVDDEVITYLVDEQGRTDSDAGGARSVVSKLEGEVASAVARFINHNPDCVKLRVITEGNMAVKDKTLLIGDSHIVVEGQKMRNIDGTAPVWIR